MTQLTTTFERVKALLLSDVKYRNNDEALVVKYWWLEMRDMGLEESLSAKEFFYLYRDGRFTTADHITRARRKCNEEYPETRGIAYKPRRANEGRIKDELKTLRAPVTP